MRIAAGQTRPVTGDINANIIAHTKLTNLAISEKADVIAFPELSLTGYEPTLAADLAITLDDTCLDDFQHLADSGNILIGAGIPLRHNNLGITISMVIFQAQQPRLVYSKKYLHADEIPFFVSGQNFPIITILGENIAPAICYELSVPEHAALAFRSGAKTYLASVAKSVNGIDKALHRLSEISEQYHMHVLMANALGPCDGEQCAGRTSAWDAGGKLLAQLDDHSQGILIVDTETGAATIKYL